MYQKHLNGGQVNSLVMLTTFFMIMLFNSSCVYVPLPAHDLISQKGMINEELIKSLEPGETTREDLLLIVGAPDTQYEQDRYFIYEWEAECQDIDDPTVYSTYSERNLKFQRALYILTSRQ